jgi:hypothetical protein
MDRPPNALDGARVICFAKVSDAVNPTGKTTHRKDGEVLSPAAALAICQYSGDSQFYLFYCDEGWIVQTDTCHMTLDEAKDQAQFEYEGISSHWKWA